MNINEFKEENVEKREEMQKKLENLKLENIRSLWYFVNASGKVVVGSKG